ncbi:hypothetical protein ACFE04_027993 [Oxalis oulophora]
MSMSESKVNVHSKLTVVSSNPVGPGKTHPLTSLDHAMGSHTLHLVFYYSRNPFQEFDLDPLRASLCEVLSVFPPVTGRFAKDGSDNWEIKCNDAGLRVLRATVKGVSVDQWLRFGNPNDEKDLTVWDSMPQENDVSTWAPFRCQITEFEGGGIAIGLSCTHMHADPTTLTLFFKAWTQVYRGQPIEHPPCHKHSSLLPGTKLPKSANYCSAKANSPQTPSLKMSTATFKFSNSVIQNCLAEIRNNCPNATPFDFLAALFWTRVMHLKSDRNNSLSICLDFRRLLQDPLPYCYFGNALHFSKLSIDEEELSFTKLASVVGFVHHHVSGIKEEEILSAIDWFESQKSESGKYGPPFRMYGPELTCVSMEHDQSFMYGAVFEDDVKPAHVSYRIGNLEGEGLIMVMPSSEGGFARTVTVTLPEEEIAKLCNDQAIMQLEPTKFFQCRQ